ncbi:DUF6286 domain-containing protein [uncultured Friedmanniella sp.]|uniref:DUF6286 domain-containing protein n=1 Tax=uncultured Friedmanniella sp. TaxID=335381 RepID=UPI0035CB4B9D
MSRSNARSRSLRRRSSRAVPATVVAVVLLAVGVLAALIGFARLVDGSWPSAPTTAARAVAGLTWVSSAVVATGAVLALVGLVLLLAGLTPGRFRTARMQAGTAGADGAGATDLVISTRALARLAAARADRVDGVDRVSASASDRRVRLDVITTSEQVEQIRSQVSRGVAETLAATGVHPVPRVTTTVRTKGI